MSAATLDRPKTSHKLPDPLTITMNAATMKRLLSNAAVAAGTDGTLPILTAVQIRVEGDHVVVEGTDRYCLVVQKHHADGNDEQITGDLTTKLLVPVPDLAMVNRLLASAGKIGMATLTAGMGDQGERTATFATHGYSLTIRLIEGEFPRTTKILDPEKLSPTRAIGADRGINARFLAHLAKIQISGRRSSVVWSQQVSEGGLTTWTPSNTGDNIVVAIMSAKANTP